MRTRNRWRILLGSLIGALSLGACKDLTGTPDLPVGTVDPANLRTPAGALALYRGAVGMFQSAFAQYARSSGLLTDELEGVAQLDPRGVLLGQRPTDFLDARQLPNRSVIADYGNLQRLRGQAGLAIGALKTYAENDPAAPPALRGELYAFMGYAELMLADLYCSGIPLSTLDFEEDWTYRPGATTDEVYRHAVALFDSAVTLSTGNAQIANLAKVGKGRTLLALGEYEQAQAAVTNVPNTFQYTFPWIETVDDHFAEQAESFAAISVADREGGTGRPYLTNGDSRTASLLAPKSSEQKTIYVPAKYVPLGTTTPHLVASGIEAQLIRAEAALQAGNVATWLATFNALRTTGVIDSVFDVNDTTITDHGDGTADTTITYVRTDTAWHPGTGGVGGLPRLGDPGTDTARVTLLFNERAAWLFVTGHRQGDLRRLVRRYHRRQQAVYPSQGRRRDGLFYGSDIVVPILAENEGMNPQWHGCMLQED